MHVFCIWTGYNPHVMRPIVQIEHLDFAYGEQLVLKHIDLSIEPGTVVGLIGPNGGGKTTLIRLLLGLLKPTRGTIRIDGMPPAAAVRRGNVIGYLPQQSESTLKFPLSVRQVVQLGLAGRTGLFKSYAQSDLEFANEMIRRTGLSEIADKPVGTLSGGQLQRVFIARALVAKPKILLLDEPTTGIDRMGQQRFIEFIEQLKTDLGLTILLVSHDLRAVSSMSDRIACLNVTLHYHDVPEHLPADLVYRMFACDLEALGIDSIGKAHTCCSHDDPRPSEQARVPKPDIRSDDELPMTNHGPLTTDH